MGKCWKNHHLIIDLQPRSFSPLQRFTLAEMTRRRKGKEHLNRTKQLKKLKGGKYLQSGKEGFDKIDLRDNRVDHTGRLRNDWRGAPPNNIEILGEIARIVTSTRILSGKIKKSFSCGDTSLDMSSNWIQIIILCSLFQRELRLLAMIISFACDACNDNLLCSIVPGQPASPGQFPWLASVWRRGEKISIL